MPEYELDKMLKSMPPEKQRAYGELFSYAMSEANYAITGNLEEFYEKFGSRPGLESEADEEMT